MSGEPSTSILALEIVHEDGAAIVRCRGKLIAGSNNNLYARISALFPGTKRIVLDLTDLTLMDSMGLGSLVRLCVAARSAGCRLELIHLGKRIREMLGVANLLSVFTIIGEERIRTH